MGDGKGLKIPKFHTPSAFETKHTHASIVLGNCSLVERTRTVVELGCGNGVVLVLIALLNPFVEKLIGVDINPKACDVAREFVRINSLEDRIEIINMDIKNVCDQIGHDFADLVVFNPPFHISGKVSKEKKRFLERNKDVFEDFVVAAHNILNNRHRFCLITSPNNILTYSTILMNNKMIPKFLTPVYGKKNSESKLVLIEGIKNGKLQGFRVKKPIFLDEIRVSTISGD